jgi:hypothetical protein
VDVVGLIRLELAQKDGDITLSRVLCLYGFPLALHGVVFAAGPDLQSDVAANDRADRANDRDERFPPRRLSEVVKLR